MQHQQKILIFVLRGRVIDWWKRCRDSRHNFVVKDETLFKNSLGHLDPNCGHMSGIFQNSIMKNEMIQLTWHLMPQSWCEFYSFRVSFWNLRRICICLGSANHTGSNANFWWKHCSSINLHQPTRTMSCPKSLTRSTWPQIWPEQCGRKRILLNSYYLKFKIWPWAQLHGQLKTPSMGVECIIPLKNKWNDQSYCSNNQGNYSSNINQISNNAGQNNSKGQNKKKKKSSASYDAITCWFWNQKEHIYIDCWSWIKLNIPLTWKK